MSPQSCRRLHRRRHHLQRNICASRFDRSSRCNDDSSVSRRVPRLTFLGRPAPAGIQGPGGTRDGLVGCVILWSIVSTKERRGVGEPPGSVAVAPAERRILIWRMRKFQGERCLETPWSCRDKGRQRRRTGAITICKKRKERRGGEGDALPFIEEKSARLVQRRDQRRGKSL